VHALGKLSRFEVKRMAFFPGRSTLVMAAVSLVSTGCAQKPGVVPGWMGPAIAVGTFAADATSGKDEPIVKQTAPQLWVSASELDFGTIGIAERGSRQLDIRNLSRFDLRLITAQSTRACFVVVDPAAVPVTLPPGGTLTIMIAMFSKTPARCDGRLEIQTDMAVAALVTIRLKGRVAGAANRS
jgi:hypothetical protein